MFVSANVTKFIALDGYVFDVEATIFYQHVDKLVTQHMMIMSMTKVKHHTNAWKKQST